MPKYKVTYTFAVEVEAPNESIAATKADERLSDRVYQTKKEVVEIDVPEDLKDDFVNDKVAAINFYFKEDDSHKTIAHNFKIVDCTCVNCPINDTCIYAFDDYNTDGDCLLDK